MAAALSWNSGVGALWACAERKGQGEIMISFDILSKPGERDHNEDYAGARKHGEAHCFVLADGLGGHGGGDEASRIVAEYILNDFARAGTVEEEYLKSCFDESQRALLDEQEKQERTMEMKTTLTVLLADESRILWGHIGDSRIYYFKNNKLVLRTIDHSVPQMLVLAGRMKEKKIRGHADRNRLLRVMGSEWDMPQYVIAEPLPRTGGEAFLLCSDGFWEWIEEKPMQHSLKKAHSPAEWLDAMEKTVLKHGSGRHMDNYSAITVFL